jgi:hypothetical protein
MKQKCPPEGGLYKTELNRGCYSFVEACYFEVPNASRSPVDMTRSFFLIPIGGLLIKLSLKPNCQANHLLTAVERTALNVYR